MDKNEEFTYSDAVWLTPLFFVFVIWFVYWVEIKFGFNFNKLGLQPREPLGLRGVFTMPFIHSDTKHLFNNSVPLFVLSASLFYFYKDVAKHILIYGALLTGLLTWVIARPSYHIGASGVVYLLFSFVFFSGVIRKHYRLVAMSLITIFLYGSMVWYLFPVKDGISWEGHLSGFLVGLFFAYLYRRRGVVQQQFVFSKTQFDTMFDENGNYIPPEVLLEMKLENDDDFTYQYFYADDEKK